MPTVLVQDDFHIRIYLPPREHTPPHVHVVRAGGEIVVALGDADVAPAILEIHGMRSRDVVRAYRLVEGNKKMLLRAWRRYHE